MANKTPIEPDRFKEIAEKLRSFAAEYESLAAKMSTKRLKAVTVAMDTVYNVALKRLRANLNNVSARIDDQIDLKEGVGRVDEARKRMKKAKLDE